MDFKKDVAELERAELKLKENPTEYNRDALLSLLVAKLGILMVQVGLLKLGKK